MTQAPAPIPPGIHPMLYAFFEEDGGALRHDMFDRQVDVALAAGAAGLAVLGLGTETTKLTEAEREAVIATVKRRLAGRAPLIATVRGETPEAQIATARRYRELGASAILLQPPSGPMESAPLRDFFATVINALDCPAGVQNAPEFLGYGLGDADLLALAESCGNFAIAKLECSAIALEPVATMFAGRTMVLNGRCGLELPDCLRAGAAGMMPGTETIDLTTAIYTAWTAGDHAEAERRYAEALPALTFFMQGIPQFLTYGKALLAARLGVEVGGARAPFLAATPFGLDCVAHYAARFGPLPGADPTGTGGRAT
ncbi:dihydrodipicolinate synthase family protein [Roseisalinus antarcticus]|uniref:L-2-keto-3-deoxyarabonate dehydratase n=1 Tax=Roseisalinus antarcticus TaxID=254357 RepID=A0A1Y5TIC9_9RHOB|nr:dihydrodipicolinate synthase family protein [Roseisalinus antarcticus]SLN64610.1 L-2-keto-3-deoxyarabonate dehydratase [Roseisalinus antarcticus]